MTKPSGALPDGILGQLAERVLSDSGLDATARQLAADSSSAGDADRLARQAGVAGLLGDAPPPLVAITRTLAAVPLIVSHATGLHPVEVSGELELGRSLAELALRHGLAKVGDPVPVPPGPGGLVGPAAKVIRAELALPAEVAHGVAARFIGAYLLLSFAVNARTFFDAKAIDEACATLARDTSPVPRFVCAFWGRA